MKPNGLKSAQELALRHPHGTRVRYMGGCKCRDCRAANARYSLERERARLNGDWNGMVPATASREHMKKLSTQGVGYKSVAYAASISKSVAFRIYSGQRRWVRAQTEQRILAVTRDAMADCGIVDAAETWRQINALLEEGFTRMELARRLGYKNRCLQFGDRILARNAMRVDRFYRIIFKGDREDAGR